MEIEKLLRSGQVTRYHAQPEIPAQSLAEHQWGVAMLVLKFYPNASSDLLKAAITHDCPEAVTGDIPSPAKRIDPNLKVTLDAIEKRVAVEWGISFPLTIMEKTQLKICDILEGLYYSAQQLRRNKEPAHVVESWLVYIKPYRLTNCQKDFVNECLKGTMYEEHYT